MGSFKINGNVKIAETIRKEVLFDGYFYDVTDFIKKHPGGTVIEYYTEKGEDGTHAIQQFHKRSPEKLKLMMSTLQRRPASDSEIGLAAAILEKNRSLSEDFTALHLELEREGYFKPCYIQAFIRVMELFVLAGVGFTWFHSKNDVIKLVGLLFIILARVRAALVTHELGHYSCTGNTKVDGILSSVIDGLFIGLSATRWKRQHNRHHAMPQRLHRDVDLDTVPILAYNAKVAEESKYGRSIMIRKQVPFFAVNSLLVAIVWQGYLDPRFIFRRKIYLEVAALAVHCAFCYHIGFWPWLFSTWIATMYALISFSLNHSFMPVTTEPKHWVEYSLLHTANVEHTPWCDWAMGYLNYQIEHHLFPTMPNFRLPFIKDRVRALAKKHNIQYIIHSYPEAWRKTFQNLSNVSKEVNKSCCSNFH